MYMLPHLVLVDNLKQASILMFYQKKRLTARFAVEFLRKISAQKIARTKRILKACNPRYAGVQLDAGFGASEGAKFFFSGGLFSVF